MTYQDYVEKRKKLQDEARVLLDNSNGEDIESTTKEYEAKAAEIKKLDDQWDTIKEMLDSLEALSDEQRTCNVQNLTGATVENGNVTASVSFVPKAVEAGNESLASSDAYLKAWAKAMTGKPLTDDENNTYRMVNNAFTHTTGNTAAVIPETVSDKIWELIEEKYPYWADVQKTHVKGQYTAIIAATSSDAAWYDEATPTADGRETFTTLTLNGCELARSITVSWKLKEMAIDEFIPYIQRQLADRMGAALGYGCTHGKGTPGQGDNWKEEPQGVVTFLEGQTGTPRIVTYTEGALSWGDLTSARAKVTFGANEAAIYANNETIWGELANVKDTNNRPLFIPDVVNGRAVNRILGMEVKEDSSMGEGEILISAAYAGYLANINKEMSLDMEDHKKDRKTDYCAYAIVDGKVTRQECHALLKKN